MKKYFFTIVCIFTVTRLLALSGGPDQFGYTWVDSNDSLGPAFHWIDIVSPDREVYGLGDDNVRGPYNTTSGTYNPFKFYWYDCDKMWIGSNGYISFGNITLASLFPNIPNATDNKHNFIGGLLADITFTGVGNPAHCYYRVTSDSIVVSWINVPFYLSTPPYYTGNNTFQIILDKGDKSITFNYLSSSGTTMNSDIRCGIENITGNIGLQPFVASYPPANYTIKFYYPAAATYSVTDGAAKWNTQLENRGVFILNNSPFSLTANITNSGNVDIPPVYTATGRIKDYNSITLLTSAVSFNNTIAGGDDTTFTYPAPFTPTAAGIHSYTTRLSGIVNDAFPSNDSVTQEVVVVDTTSFSYSLNYSDNSSEGSLSWTDGMGGIAVYFVPPSYPVKIASTKFVIDDNPNGSAFIAKIFDDNGPNGTPGTLLDSVIVSVPFVGPAGNLVSTSKNVTVTSGGIYVLWEMYGVGISIGTDYNPPFSMRSYEYVAGLFSEYRNSQSEDFLISVNAFKTQKEDIAVPAIVTPLNNANISSPATVSCWLKNVGQIPETNFDVSYRLFNYPPVTETYTGTAIDPQDSALFTFSTQIQPGSGISGALTVYSDLNFDFDRTNDTLRIGVHIAGSTHDLGVTRIISPASNSQITNITPVKCMVKNSGQLSESNFFVNYQLNGLTPVQEPYTGNPLLPGDSVLFVFTDSLLPGTGASGAFCAWTNLGNDTYPDNDTACISVSVTANINDVGVSKIISPAADSVISVPTTVSCLVKNYGNVDASVFDVSYKLNGAGINTEAYNGITLAPGDTATFTFNLQILPGQGQSGNLCAWTVLAGDQNLTNDTACINVITGIEEYSNEGNIMIYPNPFTDRTVIEFPNPGLTASDITITDMPGNIVRKQSGLKVNKIILEKGILSPGIYTLEINGDKRFRAKIVIQ